jgi:hypothetical protein
VRRRAGPLADAYPVKLQVFGHAAKEGRGQIGIVGQF